MARLAVVLIIGSLLPAIAGASSSVHTSYLWHMHQPIYWPDRSVWSPNRYETAYETITLGHSQNDESAIFGKADRIADYQWYPKDAISSILDLPEAGAQVSFAGALAENIASLGDNGWNGNVYASNWYSHYRTARSWTNSAGRPRLEPLLVAFHHPIAPLMDEAAFRMELACAKAAYGAAWGDTLYSKGYFPAETCFSERMIPALVDAGVEWTIVADLHIARACANYPYEANLDNCDPPNRADQTNPAQANYTNHTISRGVSLKIPYPFGFTPHRAEYVDPQTGSVSQIVVVPAANAMGWDEGYGLFGTGGIDAIASANNPAQPMMVVFAHDGDNAWSGGHSYYNESVTQFCHDAATAGYTPTTIATYLADHPVPTGDVIHVEDGGWVNADGDFGSPQFINWNWPLVNQAGAFDIPGGWAEDERNWAVLTAAQNRVETAEQIAGPADPGQVVSPGAGATPVDRAWHFLLAGYESGYMYYGAALDMEIKPTLACNEAIAEADPIIVGGSDTTPPTIWLPQRLPWNPGGHGGGSLWGYPAGDGIPHDSTFHVWTFVHDVSGLARVDLMIRVDSDGANDPATDDNETYVGGPGVGTWQALPMTRRIFPTGEPWPISEIDFTELPVHIADQFWVEVSGYGDELLDYYVEAEDSNGIIKRSPIQHVYVGHGTGGGGGGATFVIDGELDSTAVLVGSGGGMNLWADSDGEYLYVATEGTTTSGHDRFILVTDDPSSTQAAPWAKSGSTVIWTHFLAAEESNSWSGWFDSAQNVMNSPGAVQTHGPYLEGILELGPLFGPSLPPSLWLAAAAYTSPDGGQLSLQAPAGNGDGHITGNEMYEWVFLDPTGVSSPDLPPDASNSIAVHPNPFNPRVQLTVTHDGSPPVIEVYDVRGRNIRQLHVAESLGGDRWLIVWDGRESSGAAAPSGLYFFRFQDSREISARGVLLR